MNDNTTILFLGGILTGATIVQLGYMLGWDRARENYRQREQQSHKLFMDIMHIIFRAIIERDSNKNEEEL